MPATVTLAAAEGPATASAPAAVSVAGIDFSRTGRQLGYGRVVHSDNVYDGSVIPVPVAVLSSGAGPTVLLVAGTHGDEYEGQILLHELIRSIDPDRLTGTLIIVPSANYAAVLAGSRVSPVDKGNLNRSYPGDASGGPTGQVAHLISRGLLPRADVVVDLHSGGTNSTYVPSMFLYRGPDEAMWERKVAAARSMALPYTMVVPPRLEPGSLSTAGDDAGILTLSTELGGGGTVDRLVLARARDGLAALLAGAGVIPRADADQSRAPGRDSSRPETIWIELVDGSAVTTTAGGLFEPLVDLGQRVRAGDEVGRVHFVDELDRQPKVFHAAVDGVVAIIRRPTLVRPGCHLAQVAPLCTEPELRSL
ncbi:succinylglutamate desuccinylase/aspartoacylase family protein [Paeniglutamicibacter antarcticus]|uniref:Succinylglutamate desuccinylase/aspartoacylase family protein n=1 Tax=Arthrobacter terrae TaxID=2935737 RepID=A0A931CHD3_9MICC|nr:succinylglutamate desuccinylase/aspartoacylase family protein [Arthrobacter terrae]MBG0738607.1 succinylglutamate desuccinylase/aspartoacylase family protein [Arthrobacter terrae]